MPSQTKGNAQRLYLRDEEIKSLRELADVLEISQTEILGRIASAGIRAIKENGNRMPLPLRFEVLDPNAPWRMNEEAQPPTTHKRK